MTNPPNDPWLNPRPVSETPWPGAPVQPSNPHAASQPNHPGPGRGPGAAFPAAQPTHQNPMPQPTQEQGRPPSQQEGPVPARRSSLRKAGVIAFVAWSVLLASAGALGGWLAKDAVQASRVTDGPEIVKIPAAATLADQAMLDVRGMTLTDAKQALSDTGLPIDGLRVEEIPWSGDAGIVIAQEPVVGENIGDEIVLQVSSVATMPAVVGRPQRDVIAELKPLGVEVEVVERYELASPTGVVLEADTKEGQPLPTALTITVAQAGGAVFLNQLSAVEGGCSATEAHLNAQPMPNSLECSPGWGDEGARIVYLLNRKARLISATVGVDDAGASDAVARVVITGDAKPLANVTVSYAKPAPISLDVTGVLRLEITVTSPTGSRAILGDALVKGATDEIGQLETDS